MAKATKTSRRERELLAIIARLEVENAALKKRLQELENELTKLRKNSSNSSKPPSSDIVKPPKPSPPQSGEKRSRGGQPGHARHLRAAFPVEEFAHIYNYHLEYCPNCGGSVVDTGLAPRIIEQVEVKTKQVEIDQHRGLPFWCAACETIHYAPFPPALVKAGLVGPRLTALIAYMKAYAMLPSRPSANTCVT